jgi:predicted SAM-dependent methyltransferase
MPVRLNWGCGRVTPPGWIHADQVAGPGVNLVGDIRHGLPVPDAHFDYIVSIHALPEIPCTDLEDVLWELRRVLKPGGILRLGLPDMDRAIAAYQRGDTAYFLIPDEVFRTPAGKMIAQLTWYGRSRSMFTYEFTQELLLKSGFRNVRRCDFRQTQSPFPEIIELDNREPESLFVEAAR